MVIENLEIRAARVADADAIAALSALPGYRAGTLRLPHPNPDQTRKWLEARPPDGFSIVAVQNGRILGNAGWDRGTGRRLHAAAIGMGVHDDYTGQGIGTRLLAELIEAADKWFGLRRLELTVYADNVAAIALYKRFEFVVEGTFRDYAFRDGRFMDSLAMARLRADLLPHAGEAVAAKP